MNESFTVTLMAVAMFADHFLKIFLTLYCRSCKRS